MSHMELSPNYSTLAASASHCHCCWAATATATATTSAMTSVTTITTMSTITTWIKGAKPPRHKTLLALALALGVLHLALALEG